MRPGLQPRMPVRPPSLILVFALLACAAPAVAREVPEFTFNVASSIVTFPFTINDAEFSLSLNAIVAVSESPDQLHIYRPETDELVSVNLQLHPTSVGVSPDGHFAVVGHDAWISHVDLDNAILLQTIPIPAVVFDTVYGADGWAYAFPEGSHESIYSIHLATEAQWESQSSIYGGTIARLHPDGQSMYGAETSVSPADIEKYRITDGVAQVAYDSPYHGDYPMCGNLWLSVDGQRIYTACGNVFRASNDSVQDMRYLGAFSKPVSAQWAVHTQTGSNIAVLPKFASDSTADGEIQYFTPDFLLYRGKALLPRFVIGENTWAAHGRWVFFNAGGTKQYVVVQAEMASEMSNDFGLVTVDCSSPSISLDPGGASFGIGFSTAQFSVTGSAGCGWSSSSNVAWINTNSTGVGDGTVTYTVSANSGVAPRNGTITVGTATFAVAQAGLTPPAELVATATSPNSVSVTWSSAAVDHFEVWRSSGGAFTLAGLPTNNAFIDTTVANTGYVYKVRAVATGGAMSEFSTPDYAHTFTLTDPDLSAGMTIRAAHVTDLRTVINAIRNAAGLAPATLTDSSLESVVAKRVHLTELRDALNATRTSLAMPSISFSVLALNELIRASTTEELRAALR
jgi:hypothetical protein